jgi:hypothetical protein
MSEKEWFDVKKFIEFLEGRRELWTMKQVRRARRRSV